MEGRPLLVLAAMMTGCGGGSNEICYDTSTNTVRGAHPITWLQIRTERVEGRMFAFHAYLISCARIGNTVKLDALQGCEVVENGISRVAAISLDSLEREGAGRFLIVNSSRKSYPDTIRMSLRGGQVVGNSSPCG
jgi:hypothetical protein